MKETYLSRDFRETAAQCFPSQAKELNAFFDARLNVLLAENADASKEKQYHLQRQILPGIAAYGDMQAFVQKLRDMGYERVELMDTTDGSFMTPKEAKRLMLRGSTLLVGRK